ncbi:Hypothetical predicted protein [Olea europaea subsp. europaea]|uniref:Uncharacterized protein n=1 Tax=Olea europaea subsp. europaea TaxID=158383 RepID=A0A8S0RNW6_OLEEU|nr:Hypothetical predicted protein [Olea europaea subsp. europaea]
MARKNQPARKRRSNPVSALELVISKYFDFEVDDSLDLEDHVQSVHKRWMKAKNAGYQISDQQAIRHILDTLVPLQECIGTNEINPPVGIIEEVVEEDPEENPDEGLEEDSDED